MHAFPVPAGFLLLPCPIFRLVPAGFLLSTRMIPTGFFHPPGWNQALLPESDQVLPACPEQGLFYKVVICRVAVLDQGPLHGFFMRIPGDIDRLHLPVPLRAPFCARCFGGFPGERIQSGVIHAGGDGSRRRVEILYLLRHVAQLPDIFRKRDGILQRAAGVGRHQIRDDVLLLSGLLIGLLKETDELSVDAAPGLSHPGQDIIGDMLRRDPQLAADMMLTEFPQEGPVAVRQQIIKAEPGTDKDFFDARQTAELF